MVGGTGRTPKELSDHLGAHGSALGTDQAKLRADVRTCPAGTGKVKLYAFDCWVLIAEFYLVDRGLRHQLPGFSSLDRSVVLTVRKVSAGSSANGHTAVVALRGGSLMSGVGSIGI